MTNNIAFFKISLHCFELSKRVNIDQPVTFLSDTRSLRAERSEAVRIFGGRTAEELLFLLMLISVMLVSSGLCSGTGNTVDTLPRDRTFNYDLAVVIQLKCKMFVLTEYTNINLALFLFQTSAQKH